MTHAAVDGNTFLPTTDKAERVRFHSVKVALHNESFGDYCYRSLVNPMTPLIIDPELTFGIPSRQRKFLRHYHDPPIQHCLACVLKSAVRWRADA